VRWKFNCFVCGESWEAEHRGISASDFTFSIKKEGRPMQDCYKCKIDDTYVPIMGEMVGNRG
jgi:hypothetical protein